jgi:hypothetical protein
MKNLDINTLDAAIVAFLATLDDSQTTELLALVPNPRVSDGRRWIDNVIAMFELDNPECALCKDIAQRFDESVFVGDVFDNANGIFEAEILLREAKYLLKRRVDSNSN